MLSRKTILFLVIAFMVAILVANMCFYNCCEGFKGGGSVPPLPFRRNPLSQRGSGRGSGGGGGRRGGSRRRWVGPHRGYTYGRGRRHFPRYDSWWYYPTATIATVPLTYGCKSGCVYLGNGEWGCQFPGDGITQCQFSADCEGCNDRVWWRPTTWFY